MSTTSDARSGPTAEDQRLYQTLFESSLTAIAVVDREAVVTGWNPAAQRLFGYSQAEAVGRHVDDLVATDPSIREEAERLNELITATASIQQVTRRTRKDGTLVAS
jgi:PAS domain S-box-containing protein